MLKLVISNSDTSHQNALSQELETKLTPPKLSLQDSFLGDFQEFSPNLYVIRAKDIDHGLTFEMTLERKEILACLDEASKGEKHLVPVVACSFPHMDVQKLQEKVLGDPYLQGILMFQFQLKILEQLFLFCEEKGAVNLILTIHDADLDYLEIYRRFAVSDEKVITTRGEQTKLIISTDGETYDEVIDFIDKVDMDFRRTLWHEQRSNPAFREYLMHQTLSSR